MGTTPNGPSGLTVASLVEEENRPAQEPAPIPIPNTAERIATSWDQLMTLRNVTQTLAVSTIADIMLLTYKK